MCVCGLAWHQGWAQQSSQVQLRTQQAGPPKPPALPTFSTSAALTPLAASNRAMASLQDVALDIAACSGQLMCRGRGGPSQ